MKYKGSSPKLNQYLQRGKKNAEKQDNVGVSRFQVKLLRFLTFRTTQGLGHLQGVVTVGDLVTCRTGAPVLALTNHRGVHLLHCYLT